MGLNPINRVNSHTIWLGNERNPKLEPHSGNYLVMRNCSGVCSIGVLPSYEHVIRTNLEHHICGVHRFDCGDCGTWFNLDYATLKPQYVDGPLV